MNGFHELFKTSMATVSISHAENFPSQEIMSENVIVNSLENYFPGRLLGGDWVDARYTAGLAEKISIPKEDGNSI